MKATREQILASVPTVCPICGAPLNLSDDYAHLTCSNPLCEGKFSRKLEIFCKSLGIENFGQSTCLQVSSRISSFHELFTLTVKDFISCGIGAGMAEKLLYSVTKVTMEPVKLSDFLTALNIPKMGPNTAKLLASTYKSLSTVRGLSVLDIVSDIETAGEGSARILVKGIEDASEEIDSLLSYLTVNDIESSCAGNCFEGMNICITGTLSIDRNVWKDKIEANGGHFSTSVSKNTTCLICNQKSTSSKYKKAESLSIPIYTEQYLIDKLNNL